MTLIGEILCWLGLHDRRQRWETRLDRYVYECGRCCIRLRDG